MLWGSLGSDDDHALASAAEPCTLPSVQFGDGEAVGSAPPDTRTTLGRLPWACQVVYMGTEVSQQFSTNIALLLSSTVKVKRLFDR